MEGGQRERSEVAALDRSGRQPGHQLDELVLAAPTGRQKGADGPAFEAAHREPEDTDGALVRPLHVVDGEQERRLGREETNEAEGRDRESALIDGHALGIGPEQCDIERSPLRAREAARAAPARRSRRDRRRLPATVARRISPASTTGCGSHAPPPPLALPPRAPSSRSRARLRGRAPRTHPRRVRASASTATSSSPRPMISSRPTARATSRHSEAAARAAQGQGQLFVQSSASSSCSSGTPETAMGTTPGRATMRPSPTSLRA